MIRFDEPVFPPGVEEKLWFEHGLTQWEVQQAVRDPNSEARWDVDEVRGGRVIVRGWTSGTQTRLLFIALRPIDADGGVWACVTAFAPDDEEYGAGREEGNHTDDRRD